MCHISIMERTLLLISFNDSIFFDIKSSEIREIDHPEIRSMNKMHFLYYYQTKETEKHLDKRSPTLWQFFIIHT
jgi:hypothetical protein